MVNAYTLTFAGFLLLGGRAADLFGRRRLFLVGLGVFTVASLFGGLAQNETWLIAARTLQGLGAAILAPATLTILTRDLRRRFSTGPSARCVERGGIGRRVSRRTARRCAHRRLELALDPVRERAGRSGGIDCGPALLTGVAADMAHRHLDVAGSVTVTGGLVALVYAIVRTERYPWGSLQVLLPLTLAVVLLAAFVLIEQRFSRAPLVPLRIFRSRSVAGGNAVMFLMFCAMFGSWYFETLYMQRVLGFSPLQAGLAFLPQTLLIAAGAQVTARLVTRLGPRLLILVGTLVGASGLVWLSQITPNSSFAPDLLFPFILIGLGMGLTVTPVTVAGTAGVPRADAGLASGLLNTSRTVGASIGLAVLATLAARRTADVLGGRVPTPAHTAAALTDGYSLAIWVSAAVLLAAAAVALATLPSRRALAEGSKEVAPGPTAAPDEGRSRQLGLEEAGSRTA